MSSSTQELCHLKCELNILGARNLDIEHLSDLFIRCYVSTGGGRRLRIDSRGISSSCSPCSLSLITTLECQGEAHHMAELLEKQSVVLEIRRRRKTAASLLGQVLSSSKLLGKASMTWKEALGSAEMSSERWITVDTGSSVLPSCGKPPGAVLVGLKARLAAPKAGRRVARAGEWEECRCRHCEWNLEEEDMFALATAVVAC